MKFEHKSKQESAIAAPICDPDVGPASVAATSQSEEILQSEHSQVDGRCVSPVAAQVKARVGAYAGGISDLHQGSIESKDQEDNWAADLGLLGALLDGLNSASLPPAARWAQVFNAWDQAASELNTVLGMPEGANGINALGQHGEAAIRSYELAVQHDGQARAEFEAYLAGFQHAAHSVAEVARIVRDIGFASAVGAAVVIAAPVAFGALISGGAPTVVAGGLTVGAMGGVGAGIGASGRATAAILAESTELLADVAIHGKTLGDAADSFDWQTVGDEATDGAIRGFTDGVLTTLGAPLEAAISRSLGQAASAVIGRIGQTTRVEVLRRVTERGIAAGVSGAVIGALDAGTRIAIEGGDLSAIASGMCDGFLMGAAIGSVLGAGGGALEARASHRFEQELTQMRELLHTDPPAFAQRYAALRAQMSATERAAFERNLNGRRFVDAEHYQPAATHHAEGGPPPEHAYGQTEFEDWSNAASWTEAHAQSGRPLAQADIETMHGMAADHLPRSGAGRVRDESIDLIAAGGMGPMKVFTVLSPEQVAVLQSNPHLQLLNLGKANPLLTPAQLADGLQTAVITYPPVEAVTGKLDDFLQRMAMGPSGDPVAFAAAMQSEFVSMHPFMDGNGRLSRLVMDHALQRQGLPPALLRDPNLDYMISSAAWADEVRDGVMTSYATAQRHVRTFNQAIDAGDPSNVVKRWGVILGLTSNADSLVKWLYE